VELAAIGRRICENEHDILALLAPELEAPAPTPASDVATGGFAPHDAPSAAELAEAVREWLEGDVAAGTEGRLRFHARVAANVMGILERELRLGPAHAAAHAARLGRLGVPDDAALAAAIRAGDLDVDDDRRILTEVWSAAIDKLEVAHPGYAAGRP
jgi:hypothetical protein